ncbi:MAG: XdhC family protein [Pseudomonadota bacterium]
MTFEENVFPFLKRTMDMGHTCALATLIHIDGSSPRPVGSQIGIKDTGDAVGMITGGCAERAIIAEALACLKTGTDKIVRYGSGSPYLDVVLPCGSGIDVLLTTTNCADLIDFATIAEKARRPFWLSLETKTNQLTASYEKPAEGSFVQEMLPPYRLLVFGEGPNLSSFTRVANAAGFEVLAYSPDTECLDDTQSLGVMSTHITKSTDFAELPIDPWSAVITLFHEHDWETNLLQAALNSKAHYIGALGSRRTHNERLATLSRLPPMNRSPDDIQGPVGLAIGAKNPQEIAVSILAEIIAHRSGWAVGK